MARRHGLAFRIGGRHVSCVGRHAVAEDFRQDLRTAGLGVLVFLEDHDAGPLGEDKAVALDVEGAAGLFRLVVAGREGVHPGEAREAHRRDGGFAAAGQHHVGTVVLNQAKRVADGVGSPWRRRWRRR